MEYQVGVRVSLQRALLAVVVVVLLAAVLPAGLALERRLGSSLEQSIRTDLELATQVEADREAARGDVLMMHAKELAAAPALARALASGTPDAVRRAVQATPDGPERPVVIAPSGVVMVGAVTDPALAAATRAGAMPVEIQGGAGGLERVALAPVLLGDRWVGAAGVTQPLDRAEAGILAGLTRSLVLFVSASGVLVASTAPDSVNGALVAAAGAGAAVRRLEIGGHAYLVAAAPLGRAGLVLFARDLEEELALVSELRGVALRSGALALAVALALGALLARYVSRPVRTLADAAQRLAAGDFDAPLARGGVREVRRLADAFRAMRGALAARLGELEAANRALAERQEKLTALQAELMHRERLAATGRLVAQVAHEVRNPVASVRNCLELVRRRVHQDPDATRFLDLAVGELLRMHELTEQILDLNRPRDPGVAVCDPGAVAGEVEALARAEGAGGVALAVRGEAGRIAMAPDALKQVLVNLVQNAREASQEANRVEVRLSRAGAMGCIDVLDEGPGIPENVLAHVFDPFFTTKGPGRGVGLGLFVAEGVVRSAGGRLVAANRPDRHGAWFRVEIPLATVAPPAGAGAVR